ncbi:cuticle protein 65-like [Belonocnema kinseyi]|uniref:cuticle protein 65-like n=1 Tax=Belonocnema kinseyi TaxID=2817044 RepID=UPI00143D8D8C|nr:cuticle protein 65-like [Belonocnema kinseyi]
MFITTVTMQTILLLLTILALAASPIYAEEALAEKKVEKRGVFGLGYGGYDGYYGLNGYGAYGQHGYLNAPAYPALDHGVAPSYSHSYSAPISINRGYAAPVAPVAPVYSIPRLGYQGLGHGLKYVNGW